MYKNILVPVDGSDTSTCGLLEAAKLARDGGATVRAMHVVNSAYIAFPYSLAVYSLGDINEKLLEDGKSLLKQAERLAREHGLKVESVLLETSTDNTGELIVAQAKAWPADIIVMGTHGRRGLGRMVLGSEAEYVVRHTPVPVLLVRKQSAS
ncbi:MAG: universal stress protein [Steroidobacterales bacterium]